MEVQPAERASLLELARAAVRRSLEGLRPPDIPEVLARFTEPQAAFVTIRHRVTGALRGCRGECPGRRPLPDCVRRVAVSAALDDPRFPPVTLDEISDLTFEISALGPMRPITPDQVRVGVHGLLVASRRGVGLLLPQVPLEQGWGKSEYLDGVCVKAGLPPGSHEDEDVTLSAFEAEVWSDG